MNRRKFFGNLSALVAGAVLAPSVFAKDREATNDDVMVLTYGGKKYWFYKSQWEAQQRYYQMKMTSYIRL